MQPNPNERAEVDRDDSVIAQQDHGSDALAEFEKHFSRLTRWDTTSGSIGGSASAGAVYALLVGLYLTYASSSLIYMVVLWPLFLIFGFIIGAFAAAVATAVLVPINASIGWPLSPRWHGFVVGGWAGFLPFIILLGIERQPQGNELLMFNALGPFLAMSLGHFWAYWFTDSIINEHNSRAGTSRFKPHSGVQATNRFGITHLMILTVWVALGFAIISSIPPQPRSNILRSYLQTQPASAALALALLLITASLRSKIKRRATVSR